MCTNSHITVLIKSAFVHCIFGYANILPEHYAEYTIFYETVGFSSNAFSLCLNLILVQVSQEPYVAAEG